MVFLTTVLWSSARLSPAFDEPAHVATGVLRLAGSSAEMPPDAWWALPDPLSPPAAVLSALPAIAAGRTVADIAATPHPTPGQITAARLPVHLAGIAILLLIFASGRRLFGEAGGLVAAAVLAASPLFVGASTLVSTDLYGGLGAAAVVAVLVRLATAETPADGRTAGLQAALLAAALALPVAAKVSNIILLPFAAAAILLLAARDRRQPGLRNRWLVLGGGALAAGAVLAVLVYELLSPQFPPATLFGRTVQLPVGHGLLAAVAASQHLKGVHDILWFRSAVVPAGPQHYLWGLLLLTPLPLLAVWAGGLAAAMVTAKKRLTPAPGAVVFVLASIALIALFFALQGVYIGFRHMLVPVVLVSLACGALVPALQSLPGPSRRVFTALTAFLAAAALLICLLTSPWQSLYRNSVLSGELVFTGPDRDWGQGLRELARWQEEELGGEPVLLAWMGSGRPEDYGVRYRGLPSVLTAGSVDDELAALAPTPENLAGHVVVISRAHLGGVLFRLAGMDMGLYGEWRERPPDAVLAGGSLFVYDLRDQTPAPAASSASR